MGLLHKFRNTTKKTNLHEEVFEHLSDFFNTKRGLGIYPVDYGINSYLYLASGPQFMQELISDIKSGLEKYEKRIRDIEIEPVQSANSFVVSFRVKFKMEERFYSLQLSFNNQKNLFNLGDCILSETTPHFHTAFEMLLGMGLELVANGKTVKIAANDLERFNFSLHPYGFTCGVQFNALGDDVDPVFTAPDITKATLTFKAIDPATKQEKGKPLLELKGILTEKCFKRVPSLANDEKKPFRLYEITFQDNAKATWEQHFPINVYVDKSLKEVIEKHANEEFKITYEWDKLDTKHPITAFSLEHKDWLPEEHQVSFYSLLFWYLQQENGIFTYDYEKHSYTFMGKKPEAKTPLDVYEWWVEPPSASIPRPRALIPRKGKSLLIAWKMRIRTILMPLKRLEESRSALTTTAAFLSRRTKRSNPHLYLK